MGYPSVSVASDLPHHDQRIEFFGLQFDALEMDDLIAACQLQIQLSRPFSYVVTPNVDHIVRLEAEPDLRPLYEAASFTVCDSRILEIFSRLERKSLPVIPGSDLVETLIRHHLTPEDRLVVIGSDPDVLTVLERDFGFSNIAWHDPPMGLRQNPDAIDRAAQFIVDNNEGFAFLCVGSPQQEMIAMRVVELGGGNGIGLCCGASLDFLTGKAKRAPKWMQNARLEWLHRLLSEPRRLWKRYLVDGPRIFKIWMKYRSTR